MSDGTSVWQWSTLGVWLLWIAVYWQCGLAFVGGGRRGAASEHSRSGVLLEIVIGSASLIVLAGALGLSLGTLAMPPWKSTSVQFLGFCCALASSIGSCVIRFGFLRQWWASKVTIQPGQEIVDFGPYAVVRHPLYALTVLTYTGAALVFPAWFVVIASVIAAVGYFALARIEDEYLAKHLAGYESYRSRVRFALVPGIW